MHEKCCNTCRYWSETSSEPGYGICHGIKAGSSEFTAMLPQIPEDLELVQLRTKPEFSCTMWSDWEGERFEEDVKTEPEPQPQISTVLKPGSSGNLVIFLQSRLGITSDGQYGPQTEKAVVIFQRKNGLKVDGVWGPACEAKWMELHPE